MASAYPSTPKPQMTAFVSLPFEIQRLGHSAVETGLYMTPWPLALALAAPLAGRLADRYSAGMLGGAGLAMMTIGLVLLAFFPAGGSAGSFAWRMGLCGAGFGFFQAPNNRTLINSAPRTRSGGRPSSNRDGRRSAPGPRTGAVRRVVTTTPG